MNTIKIFSILTIIVSFSQCGSLKFDDNPPFSITNAVYENWVGGQPGISGTNVKITYKAKKEFQFDSIYFSNKVAKLESKDSNKNTIVYGYFNTSSLKNDIILDANPIKEMNNSIPEIKKFPFELKQNQAVISYKIGKKIKYYIINSLVKEKNKNFK